jgi:gliding motility-associated-like protein
MMNRKINRIGNFLKVGFVFYAMFFLMYEAFPQNVVNNGSNIVVNNGANFVITGNFSNLTATVDGKVDIDGTMIVMGDWINNAAGNNVFVNIEPSPDGLVFLKSNSIQNIKGTTPTHFENLKLKNARTILQTTNCEVNGILTLDAILDLNSNRMIIDNPDPSGITYISKYILSESPPAAGYGEIQWNIGNSLDAYSIPFGSGQNGYNDVNLTLKTNTPGDPATGNITFATYPANCNNLPLPTGASAFNQSKENVADRYWIINADYPSAKPDVDIAFTYSSDDISTYCNPNINAQNIKAMRFNTVANTWDDWAPRGFSNPSSSSVYVSGILKSDLYDPWTLVVDDETINVWLPNTFTPDGDGLNDFFGPIGFNLGDEPYKMYIYNRWGELIFETEDAVAKPWDGRPEGGTEIVQNDVYVYLIVLDGILGEKKQQYTGRVTVLK